MKTVINLASHKRQEIWLAEWLLVFHEGLCSMEPESPISCGLSGSDY
jgi:hypothetical protein